MKNMPCGRSIKYTGIVVTFQSYTKRCSHSLAALKENVPMKGTFGFTVQKRENDYVFVARQYGVVVWADEAGYGIRELENRVENVAAQFREAGVEPEQTDVASIRKHEVRNQWSVLLITIFLVCVVALPLTLVYSFVETVGHPISLFTRPTDKIDEVSPQRMAELKAAVRRISTKVASLLEAGRISITLERPANEPSETKAQ
jgi:hypothetical protein